MMIGVNIIGRDDLDNTTIMMMVEVEYVWMTPWAREILKTFTMTFVNCSAQALVTKLHSFIFFDLLVLYPGRTYSGV